MALLLLLLRLAWCGPRPLAGEDVLRSSGVPFAIVRPTALTDEPGGMPLEVDQGDTIKVWGVCVGGGGGVGGCRWEAAG